MNAEDPRIETNRSGLAFVASHLQVTGTLPIEISPGFVFRRARTHEIDVIVKQLRDYLPGPFPHWIPYHSRTIETVTGPGSMRWDHEPLPPDEWKYWVVSFEGAGGMEVYEIERAGQLLPTDFDYGFVLYFTQEDQRGKIIGQSMMPIHILEKYGNHSKIVEQPQTISSEQIGTITSLMEQIRSIPLEYPYISAALNTMNALRRVPTGSDLYVVGLFSIIEAVITHKPRLNETLDSLNHQIVSKMILLRKMFRRAIPFEPHFTASTEERVWKRLYAYRSHVTHGNLTDFENDFNDLRSHETVCRFLHDNVKELMKIALDNPSFVEDLRRC